MNGLDLWIKPKPVTRLTAEVSNSLDQKDISNIAQNVFKLYR